MIKIIHKDIENRISNLKTQLLFAFPFFGVFLCNTNIVREDNIPTMATDGIRIYYNKSFIDQLSDEELKGILIHETLHMVYLHCDIKRRGIRIKNKWNIATDYAINLEIQDMNRLDIKLPDNIMINNKKFNIFLDKKYRGMNSEQIYDALPSNINYFDNSIDIHLDMPADEIQKQEIEDRIISSYEISKKEEYNIITPGILRVVEEIRKSRVSWNRIFQRYIGSALAKEDYSYVQPNRRFIGQDLYLPSLISNKLGTVCVAVDTSGSICKKQLDAMTSELRKVSALISEVIVISCDSQVNSFEIIRDMNNFEKAVNSMRGGGGTDFRPPFELLKNKKIMPELMIYMTDGEGIFPDKYNIKYPTIWVMITEHIAPFGATIRMTI